MKKLVKIITVAAVAALLCVGFAFSAFAADETAAGTDAVYSEEQTVEAASDGTRSAKAVAAAAVVGVVATAAAIAMGLTISKTNSSIARQPEAEGGMRSAMMLGLVFIETVVIYALVVAILIIFVL